ncbi:polymorphic toxin type 44 domain-containing protein [Pseudomonas sp. AF32]|uniref:polymorphic toxin type 44 domain-containing protein n=1 Tax=Pseudomonas sp. AF32 TaxID=554390 RepID=UPI001EEE2E61|nr:polymorphic toxin type 44 domain-containing protein [Pseudomonas sp. AF32]
MKKSNKPPKTINLPPIVVTPQPPQPSPLPSLPKIPPGYTAKPLPWSGKVVESSEINTLFSKKNIKHPDQSTTIFATIATQLNRIEKAYNSHAPFFKSELDEEIAKKPALGKPSALEQYKHEKSIVDELLKIKNSELQKITATAKTFYGRNPFDKDFKQNAVDFVNIFHKSREPSLTTYNRWLTSITAAYTVKMLAAKIKILTEKSKQLASTIATTEAKEKQHVAVWTDRYNQERNAIINRYQLDKASLEKRVQAELDSADVSGDSTTELLPEQRVNETIRLVKQLRDQKQKELQQQLSFLADQPNIDFKSRDSRAFIEHIKNDSLDPEIFLKRELNAIHATYKIDILNVEIKNIEERLINLASTRLTLIKERANSGIPPLSPPNVRLAENMEEARKLKDSSKIIVGGDAVIFGVFYTKVRNKGEWDYKQRGREYEEFGNFNYGATGTVAGISEQILLRAAGAAQSIAGTSEEEFGKWWAESPYGDDEVDQIWIEAGIKYAQSKNI